MFRNKYLAQRLSKLENHLKAENPHLVEILPTFYLLDTLLYRLGLLDRETSLATRISFWPVVSMLGTFSAGKSSFINSFIGAHIQDSGNQAVDDKFTVICFSPDAEEPPRSLPGTALDADPRFPFYRISREIDKVEEGDGRHIDSYLQLRTSNRPTLKGRIFIDSPGFDADDQRRSILRISDHILDLSDLVLVFFDARHPEPGAMQDTLTHLVSKTVKRTDANKFMYVLNQIDTAAKEDNPEAVIAAWQRSISQAGLVSGRFYCIYNPNLAVPIEDEKLRQRFESKRDEDLAEIRRRVDAVDLQRDYRVVQLLETVIHELEADVVPTLRHALEKNRRWVLIWDAAGLAVVLVAILALIFGAGLGVEWFTGLSTRMQVIIPAVALAAAGTFHFWVRDLVQQRLARQLPERFGQMELNLKAAFEKNCGIFHSIFRRNPVGWGAAAIRRIKKVRERAADHVQKLNDLYTDPSGHKAPSVPAGSMATMARLHQPSAQPSTPGSEIISDGVETKHSGSEGATATVDGGPDAPADTVPENQPRPQSDS